MRGVIFVCYFHFYPQYYPKITDQQIKTQQNSYIIPNQTKAINKINTSSQLQYRAKQSLIIYQTPIPMLNIMLNKSQSLIQSKHSSSYLLNPQKPTVHKTSQSSQHQKDIPSLQEYSKLQSLLQTREASLREHAKHQYQLKLYIEDLEEKNKALEKNNAEILAQYKSQVLAIRKENQGLKKSLKKLEAQNLQMRRQFEAMLVQVNSNQKSLSNNHPLTPLQQTNKQQSQPVIKVIQSMDYKNSVRQSQPNFRLLPYTLAGKQSPLLLNYQSHRNIHSQSKQKLQVTIKSSRQLQKPKSSTSGRNQKHILGGNDVKREEHLGGDRSIKKLMQLKKMNEGQDVVQLRNRKLLAERGGKVTQYKRIQQHQINNNSNGHTNNLQDKGSNQKLQPVLHQKIVIKGLAKEFSEQLSKSNNNTNSKQLLQQQKKSKSTFKTNNNQHELIKLGHYTNPNLNTERLNHKKQHQNQ